MQTIWLVLLLRLFLGDATVTVELGKREVCRSTIFGQPKDRLAGGRALGFSPPRKVHPDDVGAAHRTLPVHSWVLVTNRRTRRSTVLRIVDHGPYGRRAADGTWYNAASEWRARQVRPGRWTSCLDLTVGAAKLLDHDGAEPTEVRPIRIRLSRPPPVGVRLAAD